MLQTATKKGRRAFSIFPNLPPLAGNFGTYTDGILSGPADHSNRNKADPFKKKGSMRAPWQGQLFQLGSCQSLKHEAFRHIPLVDSWRAAASAPHSAPTHLSTYIFFFFLSLSLSWICLGSDIQLPNEYEKYIHTRKHCRSFCETLKRLGDSRFYSKQCASTMTFELWYKSMSPY